MKLCPALLFILLTLVGCKRGSTLMAEKTVQAVGVQADVQLEEIGPGVWVHSSYRNVVGFGRVLSNGIVVTSGDEAVLIDTGWSFDSDAATEFIMEEVRQASGQGLLVPFFLTTTTTVSQASRRFGEAVSQRMPLHVPLTPCKLITGDAQTRSLL